MQDVDILTKIIRYCSSTSYIPKEVEGYTKEVYDHAKGFEQGIAHAKERILEIINSEQ